MDAFAIAMALRNFSAVTPERLRIGEEALGGLSGIVTYLLGTVPRNRMSSSDSEPGSLIAYKQTISRISPVVSFLLALVRGETRSGSGFSACLLDASTSVGTFVFSKSNNHVRKTCMNGSLSSVLSRIYKLHRCITFIDGQSVVFVRPIESKQVIIQLKALGGHFGSLKRTTFSYTRSSFQLQLTE